MKTRSAVILACGLLLLMPLAARAQEQDKPPRDESRQEVAEVKRLLQELSARLEKIDARLGRVEQQLGMFGEPAGRQAKPRGKLRPLGSRLMVDENGVIWDGGSAVGHWGVNGGDISPLYR